MRFTKVKIDNFYNLKEVDLDLTNGNTLIVGPNGAGKTNIIKCIQFLVHQIITKQEKENTQGRLEYQYARRMCKSQGVDIPQEPKIWNPNEKDCHIKLHARFKKAEVELLSELRAVCLLAHVCNVICAMTILVLREAFDHAHHFIKHHGLDHTHDPGRTEEIIRSLLETEKRIFSDLPEDTLRRIIADTSFSDSDLGERFQYQGYSHYYDDGVSLHTPCVVHLVIEVTNKLFPKLLEITKRALSEWQDTLCPVEDPDHVLMMAQNSKTRSRMKYSVVLNDDWLPTNKPKYKEEEYKVISSALQDVFGEMRNIQISFCEKLAPVLTPFYEAVRILPEINFERFEINMHETVCSLYTPWDFIKLGSSKLHGEMKYTLWGVLFSSCLVKLGASESVRQGEETAFFQYAAIRFLETSTVNWILPQARGVAMENGDVSFTINSLERQLIKSKLSEDEVVKHQFSKVKDGMKSFCGIKIHVLQREGTVVQDNKEEANKIAALGAELQDKDRVALLEYGHRLSCIGREMMRKAPSWSGDLHVMVTRTQRNETSTYSHRTSLCGLSGGEIEILMVLCTIHLSGADTVFLDEPGHSLHPPQQAQLCRWIETLQHPDPVCVLVTHSVEFISRKSLCSIYHMSFTGTGFTPFKVRVDSEREEQQPVPMREESSASSKDVVLSREMLIMLMRPDMRKMFFASGLYFVEGETDKLVLSAVRHHLLKNARHTKEKSMDVHKLLQAVEVLEMDQWDILALGGCAEAIKAYQAAAELRIPCAIVLDLDTITVKHAKMVEPFSFKTWGNSRLHKELTKEKQRNSLKIAAPLLDRVNAVFAECKTEKEALHDTLRIFQEYGIWIWEGDLESVVCDNPTVREQLLTSECFMDAFGEHLSASLYVSQRGSMPTKVALDNYDKRVLAPLVPLVDQLRAELDAARVRLYENPSQGVTKAMQEIIEKIGKCKQPLKNHDAFCEKGTKRRADWPPNHKGSTKKSAGDPSQQIQSHQDEVSMNPETAQPQADEGATGGLSDVEEADLEKIVWDRIKHKLHDEGGWMKLPWETLCKVVEVCLEAESSPLQDFRRFMKKWQCKGKQKMKVTDLPRSLLSKLYDSSEDDAKD